MSYICCMNRVEQSIMQGAYLDSLSWEEKWKLYRRHQAKCWLLIGEEIKRRGWGKLKDGGRDE